MLLGKRRDPDLDYSPLTGRSSADTGRVVDSKRSPLAYVPGVLIMLPSTIQKNKTRFLLPKCP